MTRFYPVLFLLLLNYHLVDAQTINVSGQCMSGNIVLTSIGDVNGKVAYQGTGTVDGNAGVTISVYWLPAPDNLWVLDFDGQPYFQSSCNNTIPSASPNVSCPWSAVSGTTCTGSALIINGSGVLPVSLVSFTARNENNSAVLNWKTATEINNKGFEIQRSNDGINWNSIGFVNGAGNSSTEKSYSFNDVTPFPGNNFYRLVQYDMDGKSSYSSVANVEIHKAGYYTLGNNPGNGIYRLQINSVNEADISVADIRGRRLLHKTISPGVHQVDISNYAPGTYMLRIIIGNNNFTEKLIKQ